MKPRIHRARAARNDIYEIWDYIAEDNSAAADRLLESFDAALLRAADFPLIGESCGHFASSLRRLVVGNYLLFYLPVEDGIELVRVLHSARRIRRAMFRDDDA